MAVDFVITRFIQQNVGGLRRDLADLAGDFYLLESRVAKTGDMGARIAGISAVGLGVVSAILQKSIQATGEVQRVEAGYLAVLKDVVKAKRLAAEVREFDVRTTFSYLESARASQMLLAAGFREDLIPTMYAVGNATIAAGKGTDTFVRALAIMAKIKTAGVLTGIRVNQFAAAGINIKAILKKQLGLTDEQMINIGRLKLKADVVIPAINKGLMEEFGTAIEHANERILGAQEVLRGSTEKTFASIGKTMEKDVVKVIHTMTNLVNSINEFVTLHPRITKVGLAMGFVAGAAGTIYGAIKSFQMYSMVKKVLTKATIEDTVAEAAKARVAKTEALAITGAAAASTAAAGASTAAAAGATAAGAAGATAATKLGVFARVMNLLRSPTGVVIPNALRGLFGQTAAGQLLHRVPAPLPPAPQPPPLRFTYPNTFGPKYGTRVLPPPTVPVTNIHSTRPLSPMQTGAVTAAGALLSALTGIIVGKENYETYKKLGVSQGKSMVAGTATGVAAAAASMFLPGAAVPIALASAIASLVNRRTDVLEARTNEGSGIAKTEKQAADFARKANLDKAKAYEAQVKALTKERDDLMKKPLLLFDSYDYQRVKELNTEIQIASLEAQSRRRVAAQEEKAAAEAAGRARINAIFEEHQKRQQIKELEMRRRTQDYHLPNIRRIPEDELVGNNPAGIGDRGFEIVHPRQINTTNTYKGRLNSMYSGIPGHKGGLKRVPKDDYVAKLHEGERVLTKEEAQAYNRATPYPYQQLMMANLDRESSKVFGEVEKACNRAIIAALIRTGTSMTAGEMMANFNSGTSRGPKTFMPARPDASGRYPQGTIVWMRPDPNDKSTSDHYGIVTNTSNGQMLLESRLESGDRETGKYMIRMNRSIAETRHRIAEAFLPIRDAERLLKSMQSRAGSSSTRTSAAYPIRSMVDPAMIKLDAALRSRKTRPRSKGDSGQLMELIGEAFSNIHKTMADMENAEGWAEFDRSQAASRGSSRRSRAKKKSKRRDGKRIIVYEHTIEIDESAADSMRDEQHYQSMLPLPSGVMY